MAKYRKKPVVVEAVQWFKHGDHPDVEKYTKKYLVEGFPFDCWCKKKMEEHGVIIGFFTRRICPGLWVFSESDRDKVDVLRGTDFKAAYDKVEERKPVLMAPRMYDCGGCGSNDIRALPPTFDQMDYIDYKCRKCGYVWSETMTGEAFKKAWEGKADDPA